MTDIIVGAVIVGFVIIVAIAVIVVCRRSIRTRTYRDMGELSQEA
jgi:hypothetical protein